MSHNIRGVCEDSVFTDALAEMLFALECGRLTTAAMTRAITRAIVVWSHGQGWSVRPEARVEVRALPSRQLGFVDVLICRGAPHPDVAIEIDSTDKPWSVVKLQHVAAAGMHAIWVRWGDDAWAGTYDDLDVVQLRVARRVRHAPPDAQTTIWR